jgi:predicted MPP superfamily phosphohydrolase
MVVLRVLAFLLWANVLPPLANVVFGDRFNYPIDGGRQWFDGRPLLGPHKTLRGVLASVFGGSLAFPLLGTAWWVAGTAAAFAMTGDLASSFVKRRLQRPSGNPAVVLDQIFEALFPTLFLAVLMPLAAWQVLAVLLLFVPTSYLGSRFWNYVLYRPPGSRYMRIIRSRARLREWRACHEPLARWQKWLNFENYLFYRGMMAWCFRAAGLYEQGVRNALELRVEAQVFWVQALPSKFDGFRMLLLTDLHLDGLDGLTEAVAERVRDLDVDLCLIGGDLRMEMYGPTAPCLRHLRHLLKHLRARHGVVGVLGNHDCIEMVPDLEAAGVWMLINDALEIHRDGERIWVVGIDDPHYYHCHDLDLAFRSVPPEGFRIFLAHSPEAYLDASRHRAHLYLCGHTHGGQICLPGGRALFTHSAAPRRTAVGRWRYRSMLGYTSRGVGASGIPLRFNCHGEITLITLRRG